MSESWGGSFPGGMVHSPGAHGERVWSGPRVELAPKGRSSVARGGNPWNRAINTFTKCASPEGAAVLVMLVAFRSPFQGSGQSMGLAIVSQGLPPLATDGRPVGATGTWWSDCVFQGLHPWLLTVAPLGLRESGGPTVCSRGCTPGD